jgi:hypothetical protein
MNYYSLSACENLIKKYIDLGGTVETIEDGVLGLGIVVCSAKGKKTAIIKEVYVNEWSSSHKITMYNKTPKKYLT